MGRFPSRTRHRTSSSMLSAPRGRLAATAGVLALAVGLATTLTLVLGGENQGPTRWPEPPSVLLAKLTLVCLLFLGYLLYEQYRLGNLKRKLDVAIRQSEVERERRHDQMSGVLALTRLGDEMTPKAIFTSITELVRYMFRCDQASFMVVEPGGESLELCAASGHPDLPEILHLGQRLGEGIAGRVARSRKALLLGPDMDRSRYPELKARDYTISSAMVVPVVHEGGLVGVLSVTSRDPEVEYQLEDLRMLEVFARAIERYCAKAAEREGRWEQTKDWIRNAVQMPEKTG